MSNGKDPVWWQVIITSAAAVGAFLGGIILTLLGVRQRDKQENDQIVTKYDLSEMRRQISEDARKDRHEIYGQIQRMSADLELDLHRIEDNFSEYVKNADSRLRAIEREQDRRAAMDRAD